MNKYDDDDIESDFKTNDNDDDNKEDENVTKLIEFLQNDEFDQFNQEIDKYNETKQENIIKTVMLYRLNSLIRLRYYYILYTAQLLL